MPAVQQPPAPDAMEVELPGTEEATRPPPGPLPEMRAPRIESVPQPEPTQVSAEVTRPTRPVAAAQVAELSGTVKPAAPKTFGDLLESDPLPLRGEKQEDQKIRKARKRIGWLETKPFLLFPS